MRLNLGSGDKPTPAGWTSVDIDPAYQPDVLADIGDLPFSDGAAECIFASHVLEHVPLPDLERVLAEWRRVLLPSGELVIVGPDIARAVHQGEPPNILEAIVEHGGPPHGHSWTCSEAVLRHLLALNGWESEPVDVSTIRPPQYPNAAPDARWQLALVAHP